MEEDAGLKRQRKLFIAAIILFVLVFVGAIIYYFVTRPNQYQNISIENQSSVSSELSNDDFLRFRTRLAKVLAELGIIEDENMELDVTIRSDTYVEKDGVTSFIIDIDSLKATYAVAVQHNDSSIDEVLINCPTIDLMKYPETICHGMNGDSTNIELNLPYEFTYQGYTITADIKYYAPTKPYILIDADKDGCWNRSITEGAKTEFKSWVKNTLRLDPANYEIMTCLMD